MRLHEVLAHEVPAHETWPWFRGCTALETAHDVHRIVFSEQAQGTRLEQLALLEQPHAARRLFAQTELGGDAVQHGGGSVVAADAVERAVPALQVSVEDLIRVV